MADDDQNVTGTDRLDVLITDGGDDTVEGLGGRDVISTGGGHDTASGGDGDDIIRGGSGNDVVRGGEGNDAIRGDSGNDELYGDSGNDSLLGDAGDDRLYGGEGDDLLHGGMGDDTLTGGAGADTFLFTANTGNDTITDFDFRHDVIDLRLLPEEISFADLTITAIVATEGLDVPEVIGVTITHDALGGTITIYDISPDLLTEDHFLLPDGNTTTVEHEDTSATTQVPDPWDGTDDADFLVGDSEASHIRGLGGNDWISGGEGDDTIEGGSGRDVLMGNEGDDTIYGGVGNDFMYGGEGNDRISGGTGNDRISGGAGADTFVFEPGHGTDTITDFADGEDLIDLSLLTEITDFSDLSGLISADGTSAVIDLGSVGGGSIRLDHVAVSDLDADDFVFYQPPVEDTADGM